jgi:CRISPR/Cas system-associated endonuclease Cas3-HD
VRDLRRSKPGLCEEYIAGCDKTVGCVETLTDHVRSMVDTLRGPLKRLASYAEREYLYLTTKALKLSGSTTGNAELAETFRSTSLVEVLAVFHDLGKCTLSSQRSLRESCTAPYHEVTSAALLLAYLTFLTSIGGSKPAIAGVIPPVLSVLLHHHAMRGLNHLYEHVRRISLGSADLESVLKGLRCACEVLRVPRVEEFSTWIRGMGLGRFTEALKRLLESIESSKGISDAGSTSGVTLAEVYRISILLTATLSVADNVAASLNRRYCGRFGVQEALRAGTLHGFVRSLLAREILRDDIAKAFRRALGVT